jgi:oxaloacetate decarboxylase gamma subunit
MTITEMLGQSGVLALMGMGTVFVFLIVVILAITVVSKIIHSLGMDKDLMPKPAAAKSAAAGASGKTGEVAAAISAAVARYRENK